MLGLDTLNLNQRKAVEWNEGPLLVLAGPGSGKTRVLTLRVARLIAESPDSRFRILGLTFTNKAAGEMRTRVEGIVGRTDRALLVTFHSFCADILRQHGSHEGLRPDFTILTDDEDRTEVLRDAIRALQGAGHDVDLEDTKLIPIIDRLFANCVRDDAVTRVIRDPSLGQKLQLLFAEYRHQLIANNRVDYALLLYLCDQLLEARPRVGKQIRIVYPHICVDEFQDTNLAQYRILRAVAGDGSPNLFVVADDDQIMYQWNGASPERLTALRHDYGMDVVQLPTNYRCPPEVIELANNLIRHNSSRSPDKKPLEAIKAESGEDCVRVYDFNTIEEELAWVAGDISSRPKPEWADCIVLARTTKLLTQAQSVLRDNGIGAYMSKRKNEFESTPMRWMHAMLRLANSRNDTDQLRRVCKHFYSLEGVDVHADTVMAEAALAGGDYLRAWVRSASGSASLEEETRAFLSSGVRALLERLDYRAFTEDAFAWMDGVERRIGVGSADDGFADYSEEKSMWQELQASITSSFGLEEMSLNVLLQEMDLSPKTAPPPPDAVRCLTIHSAKGMEFRHVYLIGLAEDQLPSYQSIQKGADSREMQEERRNCFVAITRTQETLTMTYAGRYFGWMKRPSRFLAEMGYEV